MFDQLLRSRVILPTWQGQAQQYRKLSDFDEPEEDQAHEEPPLVSKGGRPKGEWKMPTHKFCNLCKRSLPLTPEYFHKATKQRTGLMSECKECHNIRNKIRRKGPQTTFYNQRSCRVTWPDGTVQTFDSVAKASIATGVGKKTISFRCRKKQAGRDGSRWEYV